jgi:hypothetical protein
MRHKQWSPFVFVAGRCGNVTTSLSPPLANSLRNDNASYNWLALYNRIVGKQSIVVSLLALRVCLEGKDHLTMSPSLHRDAGGETPRRE